MKLIRRATALALAAVLVAPGTARADEAILMDQTALEAALAAAYTPAYGNAFAAHAVYVDVATQRGWSPEAIETNWPLASAIMDRESKFCPNVRGGDQVDSQCRVTRPGRRSGHYGDSGYGQVNRVHWTGWLCDQEGLCSPDDIIATPQTSMSAFLAVLERGGKGPWCWSAKLRRTALCRMEFVQP